MASQETRFVIDALGKHAERTIAKLTLDIHYNLLRATPVDTGWARANWVPSLGIPIEPPQPDFQTRDERAQAVSGARGAQEAGQASIVGYRLAAGPAWISNNVPYLEELNQGSSKQAPAGFAQMAIATAVLANGGRPA